MFLRDVVKSLGGDGGADTVSNHMGGGQVFGVS